MLKEGKQFVAYLEIFLVISLVFSLSFILNSSFAEANSHLSTPGDSSSRLLSTTIKTQEGLQLGGDNVAEGSFTVFDNARLGSEAGSYALGKGGIYKWDPSSEIWLPTQGDPSTFLQQNDFVNEIGGGLPEGVTQMYSNGQGQYIGVRQDGSLSQFTRRGDGAFVAGGVGSIGTQKETFSIFGNQVATGGIAHLLKGLVWAGVVVGAVQLLGGLFGADKPLLNALSLGAFGGIMTWKGLQSLGPSGFDKLAADSFLVKNSALIGIGVGVAIFLLTYKDQETKTVTFSCMPWEPPIGGENCEVCNEDPFRPCSEYRCKSLGQACELVNAGTEEENCVWVGRDDVNSPVIQTDSEVLSPEGLRYTPDNAIRPPNRGVKIISNSQSGCLPAFAPLEFGVKLDEPAQCKIDYNHTESFDDMKYYFGESNYFLYNHTQRMRLPGPVSEGGGDTTPLLQNDGEFSLYVRCQDANGNQNVDEFVFSFCVDPSPDTTPPIIEGTSIPSGSPVRADADEVPIELYVNEPSECRWSRQDKAYEDMENQMSCANDATTINADLQFVCSSELTGIQDLQENKFYFRCKDQPGRPEGERNTNRQSLPLILRGSQNLSIINIGPNETISGSTGTIPVTLSVETDDGANEGKAICYFSPTGEEDSFVAMFNTDNFEHTQELDLTSGDYTYYIRCIDAGGNTAENKTSFTVFVDEEPPMVTRAYRELDALKIITDEDAECTYSLQSCNYNFEEGLGLKRISTDKFTDHYVNWDTNAKYYVKCRDFQGNQPDPNECSVVVSSVELSRGI